MKYFMLEYPIAGATVWLARPQLRYLVVDAEQGLKQRLVVLARRQE
jgi:hypothetical protein